MRKILYIMIGCISLGLGIIGVILPILPTIPFVLLSAFCFAKSSERLDGWFKNTKLYRENNIKSRKFLKNISYTLNKSPGYQVTCCIQYYFSAICFASKP